MWAALDLYPIVISLTVEMQFVPQMHLELVEWIRGANPSFTKLWDYYFKTYLAIVLRLQTKLVKVEFLLKSDRIAISAKQSRLNATEFSNKILENE